nr:GNAT family N-acetyltransferase [uncultured Pseudomonas sp.]
MARQLTIILASEEQRVALITTVQAIAEAELAWLNESDNDLDDMCLIIFLREIAVGFCVFRRSTSEIRRLFVLPDYRRTKIGSQAIAQLFALFRNDEHLFITLQFSEEAVAAFLAKALKAYSSFIIEEGMILVSTKANYAQCFDENG